MSYNRIERGRMAGDRFTQISNALFADPRITFKAKGIFGLISTHRDGFGLSVRSIARNAKDGKDAVASGLQELEEFGYLEREKQFDDVGKFDGYVYRITDMPAHLYDLFGEDAPRLPTRTRTGEPATSPCPGNPDTGNPDAGKPDPANPDPADPDTKKTPSNNTSTNNTSRKNSSSAAADQPLFDVAGAPAPAAGAAGESEPPDLFGEFWAAYPKRVAKQAARRAWDKAVKGGAVPERVVSAAREYAASRTGRDPQFTKHPATWLNGGCFEDEPDPQWAPSGGGHMPWQAPPPDAYENDLGF